MNDPNRDVYSQDGVVRIYASKTRLFRPEETVLAYLRDSFHGKAIFDLGCGTGRTTPFLREVSENYLGADYSEGMVEYCRGKFPGVAFEVCDARRMEKLADGRFDLVVFSFNGLDYMNQAERMQVLDEMRRILKPGGLLVFSTHNLDKPIYHSLSLRNFELTWHPLRLLRQVPTYFAGWGNQLRMRSREVRGEGWALLNDNAHNYSLLTYYIRKPAQVRQLEEHGFTDVRIVDQQGAWARPETPDATSSWIYYLATKPEAEAGA